MKRILLVLLVSMVLLAGCGADPRNAADAYATTVQADQAAKDAELQRVITADEHNQQMVESQAIQAERVAAGQRLVRYESIMLLVFLGIVGLALCYVWITSVAPGVGKAVVAAVDLKARQIPLDRGTRQYPLLLTPLGGGKFSLVDPNTNQVLLLDVPHEPTEQRVAVTGQVQALGLLTEAAKWSDQSGTLGMLQAPVVHAYDVHEVSKNVKLLRPKEGVK